MTSEGGEEGHPGKGADTQAPLPTDGGGVGSRRPLGKIHTRALPGGIPRDRQGAPGSNGEYASIKESLAGNDGLTSMKKLLGYPRGGQDSSGG